MTLFLILINHTFKNPAKETSLPKLLHTPPQNLQDFPQIFKYAIVMGKKNLKNLIILFFFSFYFKFKTDTFSTTKTKFLIFPSTNIPMLS